MLYEIADQYVMSMSALHPPALAVPPGSRVAFTSADCFAGQITSETQKLDSLDFSRINPATGPLFVQGAEAGDALKISVERIDLADWGVMAAIPGSGLFGHLVAESRIKIMPIQDGYVHFDSRIRLPLAPMIGVIGVAPGEGSIPCGTPGSHGGNMDNAKIAPGAVLYLPVFHAGGLLSMGDVHACMGDGEVMVTGVETAARITVTVDLVKNAGIHNPILESADFAYTIASDENLETAVRQSASDMLALVMDRRGMSLSDAGMLLSAAGNAEICQVVDPKLTARFSMPKALLGPLF